MSLELYSPDLSARHEISQAVSVQMSRYYNAVGKLNLTADMDPYNIMAIRQEGILYDTRRKTAWILKNVKTDTTRRIITANGYTTNCLLNRRILAQPPAVSNIESGLYTAVKDNLRGLTDTRTAPLKGLPEQAESEQEELRGKELLEAFLPILEQAELGNRMVWDPGTKSHIFEIYKGRDLTRGIHAVTFSDEQGTARDLIIDQDSSTFKNYAFVRSEFDGQEVIVEVGDARGAERHEIWLDASLSKEEGEALAGFRERLKSYGAGELAKRIRRQSFQVAADPSELGKKYDLGDLVGCVSRRFGVKFQARITGVRYKKDARSEVTEIILGEPKLTAIGEVKLYG